MAQLDKARPVVVLTREVVRPHLNVVTIAPITTIVRGLSSEVPVGRANGLDRPCAISCDNVTTIPVADLGSQIGVLFEARERPRHPRSGCVRLGLARFRFHGA